MTEPRRVNCRVCVFFGITWNPSFPYSCAAHGFKSKKLPSVEVYQASGRECLAFKKKERGARRGGVNRRG